MKASIALAIGFGLGGIITLDPSCVEYVIGSLASIMLSPDLDVDAKNISSTIMRKKVGCLQRNLGTPFGIGTEGL